MKNRLISLAALMVALPVMGQYRHEPIRVQPDGDNDLIISIASYYPMEEIVEYFDSQYGWHLSYEDPLYLENQLTNIAVPSWKKAHPNERGFYVSPWTELRLRVTRPSGKLLEQSTILDQLVRQYNQLSRVDKFSVQSYPETRQTIIGSVHGMQVWEFAKLPPQVKESSGSDYLRSIVEQCGAQMPLPVVVGTVPLNALANTRMSSQKAAINCRDALSTLVQRISSDSVYSLSEDIADRMYVINILPNRAYQPQQQP